MHATGGMQEGGRGIPVCTGQTDVSIAEAESALVSFTEAPGTDLDR